MANLDIIRAPPCRRTGAHPGILGPHRGPALLVPASIYGERWCCRCYRQRNFPVLDHRLGTTRQPLALPPAAGFTSHGLLLVTGHHQRKTITLYGAIDHLRSIGKTSSPNRGQWNTSSTSSAANQIEQAVAHLPAASAMCCSRTRTSSRVGEIRDRQTAGITVQVPSPATSLLSTLHTNDAVGGGAAGGHGRRPCCRRR